MRDLWPQTQPCLIVRGGIRGDTRQVGKQRMVVFTTDHWLFQTQPASGGRHISLAVWTQSDICYYHRLGKCFDCLVFTTVVMISCCPSAGKCVSKIQYKPPQSHVNDFVHNQFWRSNSLSKYFFDKCLFLIQIFFYDGFYPGKKNTIYGDDLSVYMLYYVLFMSHSN